MSTIQETLAGMEEQPTLRVPGRREAGRSILTQVDQENYPGKASTFTGSHASIPIEYAGDVIGHVFHAYQGICVPWKENPEFTYFPFAWYLPEGAQISDPYGKSTEVLEHRHQSDSGNLYHNAQFDHCCGIVTRLKDPVTSFSCLLAGRDGGIPYTGQEPSEDRETAQPQEPRALSKVRVVHEIHTHQFLQGKSQRGRPSPSGRGSVPISQQHSQQEILYEYEATLFLHAYAFSNRDLNALTQYLRVFVLRCGGIFQDLGIVRCHYQKMEMQDTGVRNTEVYPVYAKMIKRRLSLLVHTQERDCFQTPLLNILYAAVCPS